MKKKTADDRQTVNACGSPTDAELFASYERLINPSYPSFLTKLGLNRVAAKARGATITDSDGKCYIDCVGGYGLFNLGHNHPGIIRALTAQLARRQLSTRPFITEPQVRLAECLKGIAPGDLNCSFIFNSGSEAVDCAVKLVRIHSSTKNIITAEGSFHGHTLGALSASGIPSFKNAFKPLVPGFITVPFGDIEALKRKVSSEIAAVMIEPIQHEAGVVVPPDGYLQDVRKLCDDNGLIFILDEIKTGCGKTGRMFACEHYGVVPDVLVLGKSLGGGLIPIGAVIAREHLWKRFGLSFAMSASSYGGNVLACCAAEAVIRHILEDKLLQQCAQKGEFLLGQLKNCVNRFPDVLRSVDGMGLLIGIKTRSQRIAFELAKEMIRQAVLMFPAFGNSSVLMVEPPIVITYEQLRRVIDSFVSACEKICCLS